MTTNPHYPYQDASIDLERRVEDLLARMDLAAKAALMFQPIGQVGELDAPGFMGTPSMAESLDKAISHFNILFAASAREIAEWHNRVQERAAATGLGIPVTISSDPRHHFSDNPMASLMAGPFSQWPETLGFAAIGSEELVERFADTVRQEYVAVGIRTALHPQIDLATEPRWARQNATFGESAEMNSKLGVAYVKGLQGEAVGRTSVSAMAKHFPGGGPQKDGEDPHFAYGREQVYPGEMFGHHLEPFKAVIAAGVAQMMPYYGMPVGTQYEEVGFGFNKQILTGLLREELGFEGIICTDWAILSRTCWGVEELTYEQRMLKSLEAGVDQFGGEASPEVLVGLVRQGLVAESRLDASVRRLLREKFRLGLFDQRYVDVEAADSLVGTAAARSEGLAAQAAAHVLLKNDAGAAHLPLTADPGLKLYAEGLTQADLGDRATLVETPAEADVAVLRLQAPYEPRGQAGDIEAFFHAGSLDFPAERVDQVLAVDRVTPTILDVYLDRPAILTPLTGCPTIMANFGSSASAFVAVLFGEAQPEGSLPFDLPRSMAAVEASRSDVPFDTADPVFRFGDGQRYQN